MSSRSHVTFAVSSIALTATIGGAAYTANIVVTPKAATVIAQSFADNSGVFATSTTTGTIATGNPFFQPLGTNGRACVTCHQPSQGWSVTPAGIQARFNASGGNDPIFRTVDGANSPIAPVATIAERQEAYSELLTKGLFRIGIGMPANAEFSLIAVDDPYSYASASQLSLFRRPLPATNLQFLTAVMWDGRETAPGNTIGQDLVQQASDAVTTHEQGTVPPLAALGAAVSFETGLFTAQTLDNAAGSLSLNGATGGVLTLSRQPFTPGGNDSASPGFNPQVFTLYTAWAASTSAPTQIANLAPSSRSFTAALAGLPPGGPPPPAGPPQAGPPPAGPPPVDRPPVGTPPTSPAPVSAQTLARQSIARGEAIFNGRPFNITGVNGLNDIANQPAIRGTCTTCHDTPNVGNHSLPTYLNIGTAAAVVRSPDLPLYTFQNKTTGAIVQTSDPGRGLITGKWSDIGKFKVPDLRGLPTRAPYFHNGLGTDATGVVNFYNRRFNIGLSAQDVTDLSNFLTTL